MELIGVTGKSGAGKTTFSDMLAEESNIGVIHVDEILTEIKLKYFKLFMKKNNKGEKIKVDSKLKGFIYRRKRIFDLLMRFRAKLIEKPLEKEIQRLQAAGHETIIIDDIFIKHEKIYPDLTKIFLVKRPYIERQEALKKRDNLTKEEIVAADIAHYNGNYTETQKNKEVYKISNNGTKQDLRQKAQEVYREHFITFKEKYKEESTKENITPIKEQTKSIEEDINIVEERN